MSNGVLNKKQYGDGKSLFLPLRYFLSSNLQSVPVDPTSFHPSFCVELWCQKKKRRSYLRGLPAVQNEIQTAGRQ